jgi:hypothetical protein
MNILSYIRGVLVLIVFVFLSFSSLYAQPSEGRTYIIKCSTKDLYLGFRQESTAHTYVVYTTNSSQSRWQFESLGNGEFRIRNTTNNMYIQRLRDGQNYYMGLFLTQNANDAYRFSVSQSPYGNNNFEIKNGGEKMGSSPDGLSSGTMVILSGTYNLVAGWKIEDTQPQQSQQAQQSQQSYSPPAYSNGQLTTGFRGSFWRTDTPSSQLVLSRTDQTLDFNWGEGSPDSRIPADNFQAAWETELISPGPGWYIIYAEADDGIIVSVDGNRVIDAWKDQAPTMYTAQVYLDAAGTRKRLRVEYYEHSGGASLRIGFKRPNGNYEILK